MIAERWLTGQLTKLHSQDLSKIKDQKSAVLLSDCRHIAICGITPLFPQIPILSSYLSTQDQTLVTKQYILQTAASLARSVRQRHVYHGALIEVARQEGLATREAEMEDIENGIFGRLDRTWYSLGDDNCMSNEGIDLGVSAQAISRQLENEGKELLYLAQKQPRRLLGIFAFSTPTSHEIDDCVQKLKKSEIEITVLTSIKNRIAKGMLKPLDLNLFHAELSDIDIKSTLKTIYHSNQGLIVVTSAHSSNIPDNIPFVQIGGTRKNALLSLDNICQLEKEMNTAKNLVEKTRKRFFWSRI